ncbi:DUF6215 domain-containing protein [Streptomyces sp. NPDC052292]|uniref:DUF6215 domain-containing protein n=1 Tax=Streptomyces sp. NPDC052292 TaxID=3155053 RepID=UPI00341484FA
MLGLLLRVLPFWVREPLMILVGSVFGVRIMYLAVVEGSWVAAGIGAVFLVFTAIRVRMVVRALQARREARARASAQAPVSAQVPVAPPAAAPAPVSPPAGPADSAAAPDSAPAASPAPAQVPAPVLAAAQAPAQAPAQAGAGPRPATGAPEKDHNAWGQGLAAVGLFGALAAALWLGPRVLPADDNSPEPASCSHAEDEKPSKAYRRTPRAVTGDQLCEALNRPDLARLLGTPREIANTASGSSGTALLTDDKVAEPEAQVSFDTYTVNLSATYNHLTTAQYVRLFDIAGDRVEKDVKTLKVLGRPAFFSSDHTMKFTIDFSKEHNGGPVERGPLARSLSIALDRKDRGGYYDITVWSQSGALPQDGALVDIAEKVLPSVLKRSAD